MAIRVTDINTQLGRSVTAIVRKQSKRVVDEYSRRFQSRLARMALAWRREIRKLLSVRVPKPWDSTTPRNSTSYPKRRTGALRGSIRLPHIAWEYRSKSFTKAHGKTTIQFTVDNFFGKIAGKGYGETLNRMVESTNVGVDAAGVPIPNKRRGTKPFAGWKERAMRVFYAKIEERSAF